MPIVPTYEHERGLPGGTTGPMATPDAFGAAVGRGLQQVRHRAGRQARRVSGRIGRSPPPRSCAAG